jgi:hypothetical protein
LAHRLDLDFQSTCNRSRISNHAFNTPVVCSNMQNHKFIALR